MQEILTKSNNWLCINVRDGRKLWELCLDFKLPLYKVGSTGLDDEKCTARAQLRLNFRSSGSTGAQKMGSFHLYTSLLKEYAVGMPDLD